MKVRSEARVSGSGQLISVELEASDMVGEVENFDSLSLSDKFKAMSVRADLLVIKYLLEGQHVSQEWAMERVRQIRGE